MNYSEDCALGGVLLPDQGGEEEEMVARLCPYCHVVSNFDRDRLIGAASTVPAKDEEEARDQTRQVCLEQCHNCHAFVYVRAASTGEPVYDMYPKNVEHAPSELPDSVKKAFEEALLCFSAGSANGSLLMSRRAIQETMNDKKAKKGDLPTQLQDLVDRQVITPNLTGC